MSYSLYVRASADPTMSMLLDALDDMEDLRWAEADADDDALAAGPWHLFVEGQSARAVEVDYQDGEVAVRLMTLSSVADFEVARRVVEAVASRGDGMFSGEDTEVAMSVTHLRKWFDSAWLAGQNGAGASSLRHIVTQDGQRATVPGAVRDVVFGPRLFAELTAAGPDELLHERVVDRIRHVQWLDLDGAYEASVMAIRPSDAADGPQSTLAVWGPGVRYLFPDVQYLVLRVDADTEAESMLWIPADALSTVAGDALERYIDEVQAIVAAIEPARWPAVVEAARPHAVDPP